MSTIRTIYHDTAPDFPATDQHPDALRYGPLALASGAVVYVDAIGGSPSEAEILAVLNPAKAAFLASELIGALTPADYVAIQNAIPASPGMGLLWSALLAQGNAPIELASQRFQSGWAALTQVLGAERCAALATALTIVPPAAG